MEGFEDEYGIPEVYSMVEALENAAQELDVGSGFDGSDNMAYTSMTLQVESEVRMYFGRESDEFRAYLDDLEFEKAYDFLDENWEGAVRDLIVEEDLEGWTPDDV